MNGATPPILGDDFLAWWFAPWRLPHAPQARPGGASAGLLAQRDGYRAWCQAAGIAPDLPPAFEAGWQALALLDAGALQHCARLYAGLLATRERDHGRLAQLALDERRWCLGLAQTQPLTALHAGPRGGDLARDGLVELACALDQAFAGLWPRLRWSFTPGVPTHGETAPPPSPSAAARMLRCWRLCMARAQSGGVSTGQVP